MVAGVLVLGLPLLAQNLMPNPGFELGHDVDHEFVAINGSLVTFSGISGDVFQGDSALQIQIDVVGTGGPQVIGIRHQIPGLDPAKGYSARVAVKGPVGQQFRFRVLGDVKQTMNFTVLSDGFNIYEYEIDPLEPSTAHSHLVALEFAFTDNAAATWVVDSLVLEEKGGDPGENPGTLARAFVSPGGEDSNPGTFEQPLKTLGKAVEMLAGDTIFLLEGIHFQEVILNGFSGSEGAPKVITAYPGHEVVLDGTMAIGSSWTVHEENIYKTTLDQDIWQLFVNGEMLNLCRWPNVDGFIEDEQPEQADPLPGSLWDQVGTWGHSATNSSNGIMIDDGARNLAGSGLDMTGAIAILNVGSFKTSAAPVTKHTAGQEQFEWDPSFTDPYLTWQKPDHAYYFMEGKLNLLDQPGEWYYDQATRELYLMTKDGSHPDSAKIRGKVQSYAITLEESHHVTIQDIGFMGTTLSGGNCSHLTIENCTFDYPSYSRRILGNYSPTDITIFEGDCDHITLINNIFQYTEGEAFYLNGTDHLMENNLLKHIDFTCVNLYRIGGTIDFIGDNNVFRNNTIYIAGASETITPGSHNTVEGNEVWGIGHLQNDGTMIQYMVGPAIGSITRYNWLHDCKKSGVRYDGSLDIGNTGLPGVWDPWGNQTKGMVYGNVIWNCPTGLMIKGDYHVIVNNTVFGNEKVGIVMINPPPDGANLNSICKNNVAGMISGYRGGRNPDDYPISGDNSHNWNGFYQDEDVSDILNDILNRDFRPVSTELLIEKGTEDVNSEDLFVEHAFTDSIYDLGAYEYGDTIYRIAGRREAQCSHPIPADGGLSYSGDLILAWRPAFMASSYRVYTGNSQGSVKQATSESDEFMGEQINNIFLPGPLSKGQTLFWKVNAVIRDQVVPGDVWSFTASENANGALEDTVSSVIFVVSSEGIQVEGAGVVFNGETVLTDINGRVEFDSVLHGGPYDYVVLKDGYEDVSGVLLLEKDTTLGIELVSITGIVTPGTKNFVVYPNPATERLFIAVSVDHVSVEIMDMFGRVVESCSGLSRNVPFDVSRLAKGSYLIRVFEGSDVLDWRKIIVVR